MIGTESVGPLRTVLARASLLACLTFVGQAIVFLAPANSARADDFSFDLPLLGTTTFAMTSTTTLRFRGDNYDANLFDDDFFSLAQRFDLSLQADELRLEVRLDGFLPFTHFDETPLFSGNGRCPLEGDPRCYIAWDVRPERLALRWEHEAWTVEAGDTQLVFGRGVALSFRKVDLLGVDTALRGGHIRYSDGTFQARIHAGIANPQNQDPIDLRIIREFEDVIGAASIGVTLPGSVPMTFTLHGMRVWFQDDPGSEFLPRARTVDVAGWTFEAPALADGMISIYAEANGMRRSFTLIEDENISFGRGIYASIQLQTVDGLTVLFEVKDYSNFLVAPSIFEANAWRIYNAAPSIEYEGPQRLRAIGNQRGAGLRVDYAFLPGPWSFSVNSVLVGLNEEGGAHDPWDEGVLVTHSWASLFKRQEYGGDINWALNLIGGARFEVLQHDIVSGPMMTVAVPRGALDRWMIHGQAELTVGSGEHSLDINIDHRHERQLDGSEAREFQVGGVAITYSWGVPLTLTLGLRWTDFQPGVVENREEKDYNFMGGLFYPSIEGRWSFDPGTFLRVFVGQTPGGQICSGGICRDVPPYEGFLVQFVGRL